MPLQRRERMDDQGSRGRAVEDATGLARNDMNSQAGAAHGGVAVRPVDVLRDEADLIVQGRAPDVHRRRDLDAEEADSEPLEPSKRGEPGSPGLRRANGRFPVHTDTQPVRADLPAAASRCEDNGNVLESPRPALEPRQRLRGAQPAYIDPGDLDAGGKPVGRARVDEPDHDHGEHEHGGADDGPAPGGPEGGRLLPAQTDRSWGRLRGQGNESSRAGCCF